MKCTDECRFCSILSGKKTYDLIDIPIIENDDFFLLSSIGAMIEGWTLVIPKKHEYSMKSSYLNTKFYEFINESINLIKDIYSVDKVIVFEHGANKFGSATACGTNHCHIHIVPLKDSLLEEINGVFGFEKTTFGNVNQLVQESEYLLYADVDSLSKDTECYVHMLEKPTSQFFRRIIAEKLGCPEEYNYKVNNNLDTSNATYLSLQKGKKNA